MTLHTRKGSRAPTLEPTLFGNMTTASTSHGFEKTPASARQNAQSHQAPQTSRRRNQSTNNRKQEEDYFSYCVALFVALCACAVFVCGVVVYESMETPSIWPTASAIDDIVMSHNNGQKAYGIGSGYEDIPKLIKSCETTMTHMRVAIKHSDMRNRENLEKEMKAFSFDTDKAISRFVSWDSLAQATVDETQNLNDHALRSTASWNDLSDFTERNRNQGGLLSREGHRIAGRLQYLKEQRPHLLVSLGKVGLHLGTIAELLRDEAASLDPENKDFTKRAKILDKMLQLVIGTHREINNLQITVEESGRGLERLRQALWGIEDTSRCDPDTGEVPLCLDNIQAAVDRLADVWRPCQS